MVAHGRLVRRRKRETEREREGDHYRMVLLTPFDIELLELWLLMEDLFDGGRERHKDREKATITEWFSLPRST